MLSPSYKSTALKLFVETIIIFLINHRLLIPWVNYLTMIIQWKKWS